MNAYQKLEQAFVAIHRIEHALTILGWDEQTTMPKGGAEDRAQAMAELGALVHNRLCAQEIGDGLAAVEASSLDENQSANFTEMSRLWQNESVLSEEFVREESLLVSRCESQWRSQRQQNDWAGFCKNFEPLVELCRQKAKLRQAAFNSATPYDGLLELYSNGDGSELISKVFDELKTELPEIINSRIKLQKQKPNFSGNFSIENQRQLSHAVMKFLGFNFDNGRLDVSTHPFSTGNFGDQRITTRFNSQEFIEALYATIHETGHASYEAGLPAAWREQPVGSSRNMSIHESQSLFFEKHIGKSRAFCEFLVTQANDLLALSPAATATELEQCVKWVEPGLIRVNADELTYPLHIVLRYEIESALINGDMEVNNIPDAWHEKMQQYLGLSTQGDYKNGCMQDVHWPSGAFGYFPSYTLGAVNAAQLRQAMESDIGDINKIICQGSIEPIAHWLKEKIWQKASFTSSQQIMVEATGKQSDAQSLISHFNKHYLS